MFTRSSPSASSRRAPPDVAQEAVRTMKGFAALAPLFDLPGIRIRFRNLRRSIVEAHKHIIDRKGSRSSRVAAPASRKDAGDALVAHARATAA
jgi:hypothetical protein